jgi:ATP-dependent Lon protease
LTFLISHYTREAGLRNLEREVGSVCRKVAKRFVFGHTEKIVVTAASLPDLLGPPKYLKEERLKENAVGIVTGLAWTQAGGEVLYVEALKMKGKGGLVLTGQLGDVMKESARAAWSYARAHSAELEIDDDFFEENEVHIHLPAGAVPKDGPSAGVTLATALISLMTGVPVRRDIAMTGEVTLSGRVLPVGGIREKALAALTHGVTNVILPLACKKDIADIPEEFKKKLTFIFVENVDEVFAVAFDKKAEKVKPKDKPAKKPRSPAAAA